MKKIFLMLLTLTFIAVSCSKQQEIALPITKTTIKKTRTGSSYLWSEVSLTNIGSIHNSLMTKLSNAEIETNGLDLIRNTVNSYIINLPTYEYHNYIMDNIGLIYNKVKTDEYWSYYNYCSESTLDALNGTDNSTFQKITTILSTTYNDNKIENLYNNLLSVKNTYTGTNSLIIGTLEIGLNSYSFWTDYNSQYDEPIGLVIQADAAGYIVGWTKAWLWDELPNGNDRIKAGLGMALTASGGFLLKKWGKF